MVTRIVMLLVALAASLQVQAQRVDRSLCFLWDNGKSESYGVVKYETVFEYPEQLLDYNGLKIKARASVACEVVGPDKKCDRHVLTMSFMPLDTEGIPAYLKDSISKYAKRATVVKNFGLKAENKHTFKGKANMYARAFCNESHNDDSEITVKYKAVFNSENPLLNRIAYRLVKTEWKKPDLTMQIPEGELRYNNITEVDMHDMGYHKFIDKDSESLTGAEEHTTTMLVSVRTGREPHCTDLSGRGLSKCRKGLLGSLSVTLNDFDGDRILHSSTSFSNLNPYLGGGRFEYFMSDSPEKGIIMEKCSRFDTVFPMLSYPLHSKGKETWWKFRAEVKGKVIKDFLYTKQLSVSCLFYYKDK